MREVSCPPGTGLARAALLAAAARLRRAGTQPRLWLFADPARLPDPTALLPGLPRGSAVVLRGASPEVALRVARGCARRGLWLLVGGAPRDAARIGAGGHWPDRAAGPGAAALRAAMRGGRPGLVSAAVHGRPGLVRARSFGAAAIVSPAFPTVSHPGAPALGPHRWAALARAARGAVALGGVGPATVRRLPRLWLRGVAGVGMWDVAGQPQCLKEVAQRLARALPGLLRPTHSLARPDDPGVPLAHGRRRGRSHSFPLGGGVGSRNKPGAPGA